MCLDTTISLAGIVHVSSNMERLKNMILNSKIQFIIATGMWHRGLERRLLDTDFNSNLRRE